MKYRLIYGFLWLFSWLPLPLLHGIGYLAGSLLTPNIIEHIPLSPGHSIVEVKAPESFWGSTIGALDIRKKYRVEVIALKKYVVSKLEGKETVDESKTRVVPSADELINSGDALVVIGKNEDIEKMRRL